MPNLFTATIIILPLQNVNRYGTIPPNENEIATYDVAEMKGKRCKMAKFKDSKSIYYIGIVFVILVWSLFPVVTKNLFNLYTPSLWDTAGSLIAVISLAILSRKKLKLLNMSYFKVAVPTGVFFSAACLLQKFGLTISTPAMFSFLENTSCIIVPLLMMVFVREKMTPMKLLSAMVCLVGVFVLCCGKGGIRFGLGEFLCALAGVCYSVNIAGTGAFAKKLDTGLYLMIQFAVHFVISLGYSIVFVEEWNFSFAPQHLIALVGIVLVSTVLCWGIRTACLKKLDPSFVAVAMPFTAVFTGIESILAGTDTLSLGLVAGAVLITAAILISGLADSKKK